MPYEELETLRQLVKQVNDKMAAEQDNYDALTVQCQDLLKKLDEQKKITDKYGQFFSEIYRSFESSARQSGEVNIPNPEAKFLFQTIELIELQASETIDSELVAKKRELDELTRLIDAKKDELKQIQRDAAYAANELQKDSKDLRAVQEDICYTLRDQPSNFPTATPASRKNSLSPQSPAGIIENLPDVPCNTPGGHSSPQPPAHGNGGSDAPPVPKPAPNPPAAIETRPHKGFLIPRQICAEHLYLCAGGAAPIDITGLVDVRLNHLLRLGNEFARTYRPQFRLLHPAPGAWSIGEQQNVTNLLNGKKLQGEKPLRSEDELTIIDRDGQEHKLMFIFK